MQAWYSGKWQGGEMVDVTSPFDGGVIGQAPVVPCDHVADAVDSARGGIASLKALGPMGRSQVLEKTAGLIDERKDEIALAVAQESGLPLFQAMNEVTIACDLARSCAVEARRIETEFLPIAAEAQIEQRIGFSMRVPFGLMAGITPFIHPFLNPCIIAFPAIAGGNSVILKPASATPLSCIRLVEILLESGLPELAISCLPGGGEKVGRALCASPRVDAITCMGSEKSVVEIQENCRLRPVFPYWCGVSVIIATDDIDPEEMALEVLRKSFRYSGQAGFSPNWILAHASVHDELALALKRKIGDLTVGDPASEKTEIGPLISRDAVDRLRKFIAAESKSGAKLVQGGGASGNVLEPALLIGVPPDSSGFGRGELAGPVLGMSTFTKFDQVPEILDSRPVVVNSLFCLDVDRAMRLVGRLKGANHHINGIPSWSEGLIYSPGSKTRIGKRSTRDRILDTMMVTDLIKH